MNSSADRTFLIQRSLIKQDQQTFYHKSFDLNDKDMKTLFLEVLVNIFYYIDTTNSTMDGYIRNKDKRASQLIENTFYNPYDQNYNSIMKKFITFALNVIEDNKNNNPKIMDDLITRTVYWIIYNLKEGLNYELYTCPIPMAIEVLNDSCVIKVRNK